MAGLYWPHQDAYSQWFGGHPSLGAVMEEVKDFLKWWDTGNLSNAYEVHYFEHRDSRKMVIKDRRNLNT